MADEVIEKLVVELEADFSNLTDDVNKAISQTEDSLGSIEEKAEESSSVMNKAFGLVSNGLKSVQDKAKGLGSSFSSFFGKASKETQALEEDFKKTQEAFTGILEDPETAIVFLKRLEEQSERLGISFAETKEVAKDLLPKTGNVEQFNKILNQVAIAAKKTEIPIKDIGKAIKKAITTGDLDALQKQLNIPDSVIKRLKEAGVTAENLEKELDQLFKDRDWNLPEQAEKAKGKIEKLGDALSTFVGANLANAVAALAAKIFELGAAAVQAFSDIKQEAIDLNREMETATIIFTNMFGDKDAALAFMDKLRGQSVELGISFQEASRIAKSILPDVTNQEEFNELLRLFAIGATDAGVSLDELTNDINEAVTGDLTLLKDSLDIPKDAVARIKESGNVTAALADELNKLFTKRGINDLESFSDTLDATTKKLEGFRSNLLLIGGAPLLEGQKEDLQRFNEFLLENQETIEQLAKVIGEATEAVRNFFADQALGALESIDTDTFDDLVDALDDLVAAISILLDKDVGFELNDWIEFLTLLIDAVTITTNAINRMNDSSSALADSPLVKFIETLKDVVVELFFPFADIVEEFKLVSAAIETLTGKNLTGWFRGAAEATKTQQQKTEELREELEELNEAAKETGEIPFPFGGDEADKEAALLKEKIDDLAEEFIDAREKADEKLEEAAEKHNEKMAEIEEDGAEKREEIISDSADRIEKLEKNAAKKRAQIADNLADDLADLAKETAEKREDIIAGTDKDLADLAKDTNDAIAEQQEEFNRSEARAQEDHKRDMQRLEEDFLDNLEDAVANRDARAIVNLRKQHGKEVRQKEEDFVLDRQRAAEDNARAIEEAKEAERQKAEELERQREEELQKLAEEAEEEKQQRILEAEEKKIALEQELAQQKEAEDLAKAERLTALDEELTEKREKEAADLAAQQEAIQEGLEARLEAVAKGLSDENEVTEEGAQAILETLNTHFGIGGNVDQLIADFVARKAEKIKIQLELEVQTNISGGSLSLGSGVGGGGRGGRGSGRGGGGGAPSPDFTFQHGGMMVADKPTTALFGEGGIPELAMFLPLDKAQRQASGGNVGGNGPMRVEIDFSGSAPPGIDVSERDKIASVLVAALQASGVDVSSSVGGSSSPGVSPGSPRR